MKLILSALFHLALGSTMLLAQSKAPASAAYDNGQPALTFTPIAYPGAFETDPTGINNLGWIVGDYTKEPTHTHGFLYQDGVFTSFDVPGADDTYPIGINDMGQVVGLYLSGGITHGFLDDHNERFTTYDYPNAYITVVAGINNSGAIVGYYVDSRSPYTHAFLLQSGQFTSVEFPGALDTYANGINDLGEIVGWYNITDTQLGFRFDGANYTTISAPESSTTLAYGIDGNGIVVGRTQPLNAPNKGFAELGGEYRIIQYPGAVVTQLAGINDRQQMVGAYFLLATGPFGFLASP